MRGSLKIWSALMLLSLSFLILGYRLGGRMGLLIGTMFSLSIMWFAFYYGSIRWQEIFGGETLEGQDAWGLLPKLKALAAQAKVNPPALVVVPLPVPTSFSSGRGWANNTIYLSQALVHQLTPFELEAVMAYELARMKKFDRLALGMTSAIARAFLWLPETLLSSQPKSRPIRTLLAKIFLVPLAPMARMALSFAVRPMDYYNTDKAAAEIINNSSALAEALWKLNSYAQAQPLPISQSLAHFFIVDPVKNEGWRRFLRRQPPVEQRIEKLIGHFPV